MKSLILISKLLLTLLFIESCSLQNEIQDKLNTTKQEIFEFPLDYYLSFPPMNFDEWDNYFESFDKFLAKDIKTTQSRISFIKDSVHYISCYPSATPWVHLDTTTILLNNKDLINDWKTICYRKIIFEDSITYPENKIFRTSKEIFNDKENDYYLFLADKKLKLYTKEKNKKYYSLILSKNYFVQNKRYLLIYGLFKKSATISFIGFDKNGHLIINTYFVEERILEKKYCVFHTTMTQFIFTKLE